MLLPSCQLSLGYFQCFSQHPQLWVVILISQTHIDQVVKPSVRDWDKARKRSDSGPTKICVGKEKVDSNFDSQARLNLIKDPDAKSGPFVQLGQQPKVETPITVTTSSSSSFTSTTTTMIPSPYYGLKASIYICIIYWSNLYHHHQSAIYQLFVLLCGQNPENLERLLKISSS